MERHVGVCSKLIQALQELMPNKFDLLVEEGHNPLDKPEKCFQIIIGKIVYVAITESNFALEYAIAYQQIAEIFQPVPGVGHENNQFKVCVINHLQTFFTSIRSSLTTYKNHAQHVALQEELSRETDPSKRLILKDEQDIRVKSRSLATGTVKLIAELFNVGFIKSHIIELCIKVLLSSNDPSELDIECFHTLITMVGATLESNPAGLSLVNQYLRRLEEIIDKHGEVFCLRIRQLILDIFEQRADGWPQKSSNGVEPSRAERTNQQSNILKDAKANQNFLKELNNALCSLDDEQVLMLMNRLMMKQFQSEEQLRGVVKIIFEHAIMKSNSVSLFALICRGLVDVSALNEQGIVTFRALLMFQCQQEIELQRRQANNFRKFSEYVQALKVEGNVDKISKMKTSLENNLKHQARAHRVATFFGELFNIGIAGNSFIFDYLIFLLTPDVISNTSIESFCLLVTSVAPKMLTVKNHNILLKDSLLKLRETAKTIEVSHRARFLIEDLVTMGRIQIKLSLDSCAPDELINHCRRDSPLSSTLSQASFLTAPGKKKKKKKSTLPVIRHQPVEFPPISFYHNFPSPSNNLTISTPFAIHQKAYNNMDPDQHKKLMAALPTNDENNNFDSRQKPTPVDFKKSFINPTML